MAISGYYYLHVNGDLIFKTPDAYDPADFIESPFVKAWWAIDRANRENAWTLLVEALTLGANKRRIMELAAKWRCDNVDARIFAARINVYIQKDGNQWMACFQNFVNLQESPAGFGDTALEAMAALAHEVGISVNGFTSRGFKYVASSNMC